ncbi:MAG: uroporphyrinogen-III C-methyltransferase [Methermicoccaceae archaeon]
MTSPKVYLVGAGPGDPELLTLRARRLIDGADVILYDQLVGDEIIASLPASAKLVSVGKYAGRHTVPQDEINELLTEHALRGRQVVRLKGGDPYIFGRGGEEATELVSHGIEVEVVPGITSAIAVPASAGIPLTHREYASVVCFITGHEDPSKGEPDVCWDLLAKLKGTLVVLMGVSKLAKNVDAMLEGNKSPETPCAIIEKGTRKDMRVISSTLGSIVKRAESESIKPPAILVVGDVVRLREHITPRESA